MSATKRKLTRVRQGPVHRNPARKSTRVVPMCADPKGATMPLRRRLDPLPTPHPPRRAAGRWLALPVSAISSRSGPLHSSNPATRQVQTGAIPSTPARGACRLHEPVRIPAHRIINRVRDDSTAVHSSSTVLSARANGSPHGRRRGQASPPARALFRTHSIVRVISNHRRNTSNAAETGWSGRTVNLGRSGSTSATSRRACRSDTPQRSASVFADHRQTGHPTPEPARPRALSRECRVSGTTWRGGRCGWQGQTNGRRPVHIKPDGRLADSCR